MEGIIKTPIILRRNQLIVIYKNKLKNQKLIVNNQRIKELKRIKSLKKTQAIKIRINK